MLSYDVVRGGGILFAQNGDVTVAGTVVDKDGEPVIGAAVYPAGHLKAGVATDVDGKFSLKVPKGVEELVVSALGYVERTVQVDKAKRIVLEDDSQTIQETVVTGIFTRKKDSFTGSVQTVTADELKRVGNANIIESLKNIEPSLLILENLEQGSNPNAMASMQIRGSSSLASATAGLRSDYLNTGNTPLFVVDGFITTQQKVQDMDMNRVQSITILKDASAKAVYGSQGANGVIVIETKALTNDRSLVTYTGSVSVEAPDLTSYNLCNALEKLEIEKREGYYDVSSESTSFLLLKQKLYEDRLKRALEGENTYWLSKPLRLGIGHKHSLGIELGSKELKGMIDFGYNDVQGAMKGSYRKVISGDVTLSYRKDKWTFRNIMGISYMNSSESPWGSFSDYAKLNPYFTPYDGDGNLKRVLYSNVVEGTDLTLGESVYNPMYNAFIGGRNTSEYLEVTDNFYAEYQLHPSTKLVARLGVETKREQSDVFKPADHTDFMSFTAEDERLRRGSYDLTNGTYTRFSGDVSAQFNHTFNKVHDVFATAQYSIAQSSQSYVTHYAEGFPNSNMNNITFARQYAMDSTPTGYDGINRNLGALLTGGYSYGNRYMADATVKANASSVFGVKNHWGLFWSAGLAWNLHNETFLKDASSWLKQLKLRGSIGSSGNQGYSSNVSLPVYRYYSNSYYNGFSGASLENMENPDMGWEEKMDYNIAVDLRTTRLDATLEAYIADTRNMVFTRTLLPSSGFSSVNDNLGKVRNKGIEASLSYTLYRKGASYFSVFGKVAFNDNRILEISDELDAFNKEQQANALLTGASAPVVQYYDGMPIHSIWAVHSLGIDPVTGKEIYEDLNGSMTDVWSYANIRNCGSSDPLYNGNFGFNGEIKGIGLNLVMSFYGGGYTYNTTLLSKVEGADIQNNVDRRIYAGRWFKPGQVVPYKMGFVNQTIETRPTDRFVQKNNVLNIASLSLYYEFPMSFVRRLRMDRLRATLYLNDLYTFSSIEIERGTGYPYARTFSFSINATF